MWKEYYFISFEQMKTQKKNNLNWIYGINTNGKEYKMTKRNFKGGKLSKWYIYLKKIGNIITKNLEVDKSNASIEELHELSRQLWYKNKIFEVYKISWPFLTIYKLKNLKCCSP